MEAGTPSPSPARPRWPKACGCGEVWSRTEWPELPPVGRYLAGTDGWIEIRTCVCGATLVVTVAELGEVAIAKTARTPKGVDA